MTVYYIVLYIIKDYYPRTTIEKDVEMLREVARFAAIWNLFLAIWQAHYSFLFLCKRQTQISAERTLKTNQFHKVPANEHY